MTRSFFSSSKMEKITFVFCFSLSMVPFQSTIDHSLFRESSLSLLKDSVLKAPVLSKEIHFSPSLREEVSSLMNDWTKKEEDEVPPVFLEQGTDFSFREDQPIQEENELTLEIPPQKENSILDDPSIPEEIWSISYIPWQGQTSAPLDGRIGLWADGWFIAHRNTPNGQKIASLVAQIEVDGQFYSFDETWIASDEITPDEIARIRAHNGLTFQTCIDDKTNQMVHYRPALGFSGYSYQFIQYPYTIHDTVAIGYLPTQVESPTSSSLESDSSLLESDSSLSSSFTSSSSLSLPTQDASLFDSYQFQEIPFILEEPLEDFLFF